MNNYSKFFSRIVLTLIVILSVAAVVIFNDSKADIKSDKLLKQIGTFTLTGPVDIKWRGITKTLWLSNVSTDTLQVSFDSGTNWWTIPPNQVDVFMAGVNSFKIKPKNGTPQFQMLAWGD